MTISTTTSVVTYAGNGATTLFSFPFVGVSEDDIEVIYTDASGITTPLPPSTYTLVINPVPVGGLWGIGGSVTYPNSGSPVVPIPVGTYITINRIVPFTQDISISNQGAFYPRSVEQGLDLLELQLQQLETDLEYTLKFPVSDYNIPDTLPSVAARANGYLAFDADGQPYITTAVTPIGPTDTVTIRKVSTTGTTTVPVLTSDAFSGVSIYQSSTPVTSVQLPADGGPYTVFDGGLNAGTYTITILPPVGLTILGQAAYYLTHNGQAATFYYDGTQILVG